MSKTVIELSKGLLGKFNTLKGPVKGNIFAPQEVIANEVAQLAKVVPGESWKTPIGGRAFDFILDGEYHIALTIEMGEDELDSITHEGGSWLKSVSLPGATFLYVAEKLRLQPTLLDPQAVEQFIEGPANEDGVPLNTLIEHLEKHRVFRLAEPVSDAVALFKKASHLYVANYICTFDAALLERNRISKDALDQIREFFHEEKEHLFVENFFSAMSTPLLPHAFLEIYRTLEFAFVLPRASALLNRIDKGGKLGLRILDFARVCHQELGWKRVERDALQKLFSDYINQDRAAFSQLCNNCSPFSNIATPDATAKAKEHQDFMNEFVDVYYKLRNQVAHQFWADEIKKCTDADWQALIEFTLRCALHIYNKHLTK